MHQSDERFGTIVFEFNLDTDALANNRIYDQRWLIKECFRYYKHVTDFDDTRVHSDVSVYGSKFVTLSLQ